MWFGWLLLFSIPVIVSALVARKYLHETFTWQEFAAQVVIMLLVVSGVLAASYFSDVGDREILNGKIISKHREHDSHLETYSCRCNKDGCSTCTRRVYTVEWYANSTIGRIDFDSERSNSPLVYSRKDPDVFVQCKDGEPASRPHWYKNFVKSSPDSLFNTKLAYEQYANKIPSYPQVYSFYKIRRVIPIDLPIAQSLAHDLNQKLSHELITLGPQKQANILAIITGIQDPAYKLAVENEWLGGKKNDIIVFIGVDKEKNITWADAITWAKSYGNEELVANLKYELMDLKQFDSTQISATIAKLVRAQYTRPKMSDFEYLNQLNVTPLVFFVLLMVSLIGSAVCTLIFHRTDYFN